MKRVLLLLILALLTPPVLYAQTNPVARFIRKMYFEKDSARRSSFIIVPVFSSAPETGLELGATGLYSFYTDSDRLNTRISNIFAYASQTTKGQTNFTLTSNYWSPQNKYHLTGSISYINFPYSFFGVGNNTRQANEDHLDQKRFKLNIEGEKRLGEHFYAGIVAGGYYYHFHSDNSNGTFQTDPRVQFRQGGPSIYLGPSAIFDNRNNNSYTTRGMIITTYYNQIQSMFSNNGFQGGFFNIEYSQFIPITDQLVLGADIQEQNLVGGSSPFYLLPSLGNDEMMRGYYNGRFRDRNLIAAQAELRYRLAQRFAVVGFAATGEVARNGYSFDALKPDYGGGLRYFFDVAKGLTIRADYGAGQKLANEKRQSGFYIALGEAF